MLETGMKLRRTKFARRKPEIAASYNEHNYKTINITVQL